VEPAAQRAPTPVVSASKPMPTPALLLAMLGVSNKVSDLILSPGSFPAVELSGKLSPVNISGRAPLTPEDTRRIAYELIDGNRQATDSLQTLGSCDISYRVPEHCRFRVNIVRGNAVLGVA
jgi:twitching motility protein PilT